MADDELPVMKLPTRAPMGVLFDRDGRITEWHGFTLIRGGTDERPPSSVWLWRRDPDGTRRLISSR